MFFFPFAHFPPTFNILLFLSLFLPDVCTCTHTNRHSDSSCHVLPFPLIPCFSQQMAKPKMPQEQLVLMISKYYKSSHSHGIFTKRDPEDGSFSTDHRGFCSLKIHNVLILPPLSLKAGQLLAGWMKTSFRLFPDAYVHGTSAGLHSVLSPNEVKKQWSSKCSPNHTKYLINMEQDSTCHKAFIIWINLSRRRHTMDTDRTGQSKRAVRHYLSSWWDPGLTHLHYKQC